MTFVSFNGLFQDSQKHSDQRWFVSIIYSQISHDSSLNYTKINHIFSMCILKKHFILS